MSPIRSPQERIQQILETLEFSKNQRERANVKDPLTVRDRISWLLQEVKLEAAYNHLSGMETECVKKMRQLHKKD